jgi:enterobactin synthetase component D
MNQINTWAELFSHSTFFFLQKNKELTPELEKLLSRLVYKNIDHFHPERKNEFLLGRLCASKAFEKHFSKEQLSILSNVDRAPIWPVGVVGSITHNASWVGACVSEQKLLLGVGIDFELMGRVKLEISRHVLTSEDLKEHDSLNAVELLTIIFSAKESLYKALYPIVQSYFGFNSAAVKEIDVTKGIFKIELVKQISLEFGPLKRFYFEGKFRVSDGTCLTVIEIPLK